MKLTDTHLILLTTASQRENGSLIPLPESLGGVADRVRKAIAALIRNGLVKKAKSRMPRMPGGRTATSTSAFASRMRDAKRSALRPAKPWRSVLATMSMN